LPASTRSPEAPGSALPPGKPEKSATAEPFEAPTPGPAPETAVPQQPDAAPAPTAPAQPQQERAAGGGAGHGGDSPDDFTAELIVDGNRVGASLVGVTGDGPGRPYGWRDATQAPPPATLPVVLGESDGRRLFLDLGRCPDVLTVVGARPDGEKYALRLIRQLLANGHGVAVLGDELFRDALPAGCRRLGEMADVRGLDAPGIVVCGRLAGKDIAAARLSRASGGPIPVLVGEVPRARWSLQVAPA
jgi:hypothetical protein